MLKDYIVKGYAVNNMRMNQALFNMNTMIEQMLKEYDSQTVPTGYIEIKRENPRLNDVKIGQP